MSRLGPGSDPSALNSTAPPTASSITSRTVLPGVSPAVSPALTPTAAPTAPPTVASTVPPTAAPTAPPTAQAGRPAPAAPRRRASRAWLWLTAATGALALALGALALVDNGALLERMLAPLAAVQQPLVELAENSRGDGPDGVEYVLFLRDGAAPATLAGFFREHPAVRYVSPGLLPGIAVVHIRGELAPALEALRGQPQVRLALKSRLGMVCH